MNKRVSIIIPTFNRAEIIKETIESIRNQTYTDWECIIVDGGSTDQSEIKIPSYFKSDNRFQYHVLPIKSNKGPNPSRNFGFNLATGDYVYFFDSDDILMPFAFETYISNFENEYDVVIARLEKVDHKSKKTISINTIQSDNIIEDYFTGVVSFYVCGPMWRKSFLDKQTQLFDNEISNLDDWDFNLRMLYNQPKIKYLDEVLIHYFQHEASLKQELNKLNLSEIDSAFRARYKHLTLITKYELGFKNIYLGHINNFYKHYLRLTLRSKSNDYLFFLIKILKIEWELFNVMKVFKVVIGTFMYKYLKKGERFLY